MKETTVDLISLGQNPADSVPKRLKTRATLQWKEENPHGQYARRLENCVTGCSRKKKLYKAATPS
jgi:hypothetical protein